MNKQELLELLDDRIDIFKKMPGNTMKTEAIVRLLEQIKWDVQGLQEA